MKLITVMVAAICLPATGIAADVRARVPDYDKYAPNPTLKVDRGTAKTLQVTDWATYVLIEGAGPGKVALQAPGYRGMRLIDLLARQRLSGPGDRMELRLGKDGYAWVILFAPLPPVSVYEYNPKTQLRVPDSTPKKAKYPVVDVHSHLTARGVTAASRLPIMDEVGVALVMDSPLAMTGLKTEDSFERFEKERPDRFLTLATLDLERRHQAGFEKEVIRRLDQDVSRFGVVGVGETHDKGSGMFGYALLPDPRPVIHIDDERMAPIWRAIRDRNVPVLIHVGDPLGFYEPPSKFNDHLMAISRAPWFRLDGLKVPSNSEMRRRRDRLFELAPGIKIIGAHMGEIPEDLGELGAALRRHPNLYVEIGVRHSQLARQPHAARKFFLEFQDRILYGADKAPRPWTHTAINSASSNPTTTPSHAVTPSQCYGLNLPDTVLKKLYYANAARLMPKVKERLLKTFPSVDFPEPGERRQ